MNRFPTSADVLRPAAKIPGAGRFATNPSISPEYI